MPKVFVRSKGGEKVTVEQQRQKHEHRAKAEPTYTPEPVPEPPREPKRPMLAEPCSCGGVAVNGGRDDGGWRCFVCGRPIRDDDPRLAGKRV